MPKPQVIRAPAYLCLCGGVVTALLAVSIGAFLDPSVNTADPDWMFWAWPLALLLPLLRAPFVGVVVHDDHPVRRTWLQSVTLPRSEIIDVETTNYSGLWNWGNASLIFRMASLQLGNGSSTDVPGRSTCCFVPRSGSRASGESVQNVKLQIRSSDDRARKLAVGGVMRADSGHVRMAGLTPFLAVVPRAVRGATPVSQAAIGGVDADG